MQEKMSRKNIVLVLLIITWVLGPVFFFHKTGAGGRSGGRSAHGDNYKY